MPTGTGLNRRRALPYPFGALSSKRIISSAYRILQYEWLSENGQGRGHISFIRICKLGAVPFQFVSLNLGCEKAQTCWLSPRLVSKEGLASKGGAVPESERRYRGSAALTGKTQGHAVVACSFPEGLFHPLQDADFAPALSRLPATRLSGTCGEWRARPSLKDAERTRLSSHWHPGVRWGRFAA